MSEELRKQAVGALLAWGGTVPGLRRLCEITRTLRWFAIVLVAARRRVPAPSASARWRDVRYRVQCWAD